MPTEILGRYDNSAAPVVIYAVFILILSALLRALFHHARKANLLAPGQEAPVDNFGAAAVWIAFALSIPVAFVSPDLGMYCWILAWPLQIGFRRVFEARSA